MQGKFALFTDLWNGVCRLKEDLSTCHDAFVNNDFSRLGVPSLTPVEKESFIATFKAAITNLNVRFPCPSRSLNKRHARNRVACLDGSVDTYVVSQAFSSCPLRPLLDVYTFPNEFLLFSTIKQHLLFEYNGDVRRLCVAMIGMKEVILSSSGASATDRDNTTDNSIHQITLNDVFEHINPSEFPWLWKCVLEVRAINPTTVSCEQSFSCLKRSHRVNMRSENLCSLVDFRLMIRGNDMMTTQLTHCGGTDEMDNG